MASDGFSPTDWWASIPVLGAVFGFAMRLRSNSKREIDALRTEFGGFKEEVAKTRASNGYVAEVEHRLGKQLTRIEDKLDRVIEARK